MRDLTNKFLSEDEKNKIRNCVAKAEKTTSGEIVPMVVTASYHYPMAEMTGSLILSLLTAVIATLIVTVQKSWGGITALDMWLFPAVFAVAFVVFYELIKNILFLKRLLITKDEMKEEVGEAALKAFYSKGLTNTRDRTGILIYISVFEKLAYVLADEGINSKVNPGVWQEIVDIVVESIKAHKQTEGICEAVKRCGELIEKNFPIKPDDTNELDNLIVD
ncbi:MAG: hypothetical protein DRP57_06585 [Spirochaetes bacterium]|nr:MAG: hypothetical protein DRP57_06585 [Spirochaetota bacterium]